MRDIEKDRELCNAADDGPWKIAGVEDWYNNYVFIAYLGELDVAGDHKKVFIATDNNEMVSNIISNAQFIAAAREALPHYIDRAEAAEAQVSRLIANMHSQTEEWMAITQRLGLPPEISFDELGERCIAAEKLVAELGAQWLEEHTERIQLEERLKLAEKLKCDGCASEFEGPDHQE